MSATHKPRRERRPARKRLRALFIVVGAAFIALLVGVLTLGVPPGLARAALERAAPEGMRIDAGRVRLLLFRGVSLSRASFAYGDATLHADRVVIRAAGRSFRGDSELPVTFEIFDGRIQWSAADGAPRGHAAWADMTNVAATVQVGPGRIDVLRFYAESDVAACRLHGDIALPVSSAALRDVVDESKLADLLALRGATDAGRASASVSFSRRPVVDGAFHVDADAIGDSWLRGSVLAHGFRVGTTVFHGRQELGLAVFNAGRGFEPRLQGALAADAVDCGGVALSEVTADADIRPDRVALRNVTGRLGGPGGQEPVAAGIELDVHTREYTGWLQSSCRPSRLRPLLPAGVQRFLESLSFSVPPNLYVTFSGVMGDASTLSFGGYMFATQARRHGAAIESFAATVAFTNQTLALSPFSALLPSGGAWGHIGQNVATEEIAFRVQAAAHPRDVASIVHPRVATQLAKPIIAGKPRTELHGRVGYGTNRTRQVQAWIAADRLGLEKWALDGAQASLALDGGRLTIEQVEGRWLGGRLKGAADVDTSSSEIPRWLSASVRIDGAALEQIATKFGREVDPKAYKGVVAASFDWSADAGGKGSVKITDGYLLSVRLLGGLSRYLAALKPGLGYSSLRTFAADFTLNDGVFRTDNAILQGPFVEASGRGSCALSGELDFKVRVTFAKKGLDGEVLRLLTAPASKILEFRLRGTLADPRWEPINTPPALLKYFKEKLTPRSSKGPRANHDPQTEAGVE